MTTPREIWVAASEALLFAPRGTSYSELVRRAGVERFLYAEMQKAEAEQRKPREVADERAER